jgi:cathepsin F
MKAIFVVALLVLPAVLALPTAQFEAFLAKYGKHYTGAEYERRLQIFERNMRIAAQHQREDPTAEHGPTIFSDMTYEEWSAQYLMAPVPSAVLIKNCLKQGVWQATIPHDPIPDSFDWREKPNVVTEVKDQASCGSCWAFSTAGNIEGVIGAAGNPVGSLSPQFIVDCSKGCTSEIYYGSNITVCNQGCSGGWPWSAFYDVIDQGGIPGWSDYSYTGRDGACKGNKNSKILVKIANFSCISGPDSAKENQIQSALMHYGPLSIALNANYFNSYKNGIMDPAGCPSQYLNHAVLLVGWGTDSATKMDYWLIKNSWGTSWGEKGYVRLRRNKPSTPDGVCGVNEGLSTACLNADCSF